MTGTAMTTHTNGNHPTASSPGAAIYVDTENLRDSDHAQNIVAQIIANWTGPLPLGGVSLYVRADKIAVWEMWAESSYPDLRVRVRGIQHFSNHKAKNSADLAITADAVADLVTGQAAAVAVVSNDSDFGALFVKIKEMAHSAGLEHTPFLWITSPDAGALSPEMERFIPDAMRWDLSSALAAPAVDVAQPEPQPLPKPARPAALPPASAASKSDADSETVAEELIRQLPVGRFKAADAQKIVKMRWSKHPAASGDTAQFGQFLGKEVWPALQKRGVTMPGRSSPRTYEITQAAKDSIAKAKPESPTQPPSREQSDAEPTPARIAATVAATITDDLFSATAAQAAIKSAWPQHPAAKTTPQRFGLWFSEQLWPIMERHGVVLAKEKPRRYEMTPDARHRLTALD